MISFAAPLALFLAIPLMGAAVYFWRTGYDNLGDTRRNVALAIRIVLLSAVVLGLAGLTAHLPQSREAVVFVADLSNSDVGQKARMQHEINIALKERPGDSAAGVIAVGRQAQVEQPVSPLTGFNGFQSSTDTGYGDYTNLESGLELANALLPQGYRHRVVLLTDGRQNIGDAVGAARLLRSQGVRVDVMPVHTGTGPETLVSAIRVPAQLRPQERVPVTVTLHASIPTGTRLDVFRDHTLIETRSLHLQAGSTQLSFDASPLSPGFHTYSVRIYPAQDTLTQNNSGSAYTSVTGPPHVLVISDHPGETRSVMASLKTTGIQAMLERPPQVVPTLAYLQKYAAIVIVDTAADVLGPDLTAQLVPYVRDLGRGLVVIGGQESYGMGGYGNTPLETALPVKMDLPKRKDLPSAAVSLVVESLEAPMPVNISKAAAKGVVNLLNERDQVSVNDTPFTGGGWVVPLQYVRNKARIDHAIDSMNPGDPMSYVSYLKSAFTTLRHARARVRHIILLGDGDAEDASYERVVKRIRAGGVTVSTVGTNGLGLADYQTMANIARWGGGRFYRADNTASIPRIFLREARTVARSGIITGRFYPQELSANPMLRDITAIPPLYGYVATTPKPTGEMVLVSKKLDPVLAAWQFGAGRSVAWTSDAAGLWTRDWLSAPHANRFWGNLVSWTLPNSGGGHLLLSTGTNNGQGTVGVDVPRSLGADPSVTARVLSPDGTRSEIQLQPTAPGHFAGSFLANTQGSYFMTVEARGNGHADAGQAGLDVPYSAEYLATGTDTAFLSTLARAGGGTVTARPADAWLSDLPAVTDQRNLAPWLALLALLLIPLDVGVRRLILTRSDLSAILAALPWRQQPVTSVEPAVAPLGAIRSRRSRASPAPRPASEPVPPGAVHIAPSVPTPGRASSGGLQAAEPQRDEAPRPTEDEESTTSRLLAARRKRR